MSLDDVRERMVVVLDEKEEDPPLLSPLGIILELFKFICSLLVSCLVVIHWRGMWYIFDEYVLPHDLAASAWLSFGIGVGICFLCSFWQLFLKQTLQGRSMLLAYHQKMPLLGRECIRRIVLYMISFGVINVWRGIWLVCDAYMLDGDRSSSQAIRSNWISHYVAFVFLLLLWSGSSLIAPPFMHLGDSTSLHYDPFRLHYPCLRKKPTVDLPDKKDPSYLELSSKKEKVKFPQQDL